MKIYPYQKFLSLIDYKESVDESETAESIKKMFPKNLWNKVLSLDESIHSKLTAQQEAQAKQYLKNIERIDKVDSKYVEKNFPLLMYLHQTNYSHN